MGIKFDQIYESVVSRYQVGGYLPGDIVKFRPDYKSCDCYKAMHSTMKQELDALVKSGLNIKVIQVGDKLSGVSAGNQHKTANNIVITVAGDQGGGRHYGSIAVMPEMLDIVDTNNPNPKVPDQFYRDDEKYLNGKTEKYTADPKHITRLTDKGNGKNTPTDLKLAGESTLLNRDNENLAMLYEMVGKSDRISDKDRHRITNVVTNYGLDGNGRFETVGKALHALTQALDSLGYSLDAVTGNSNIASAHHTPGAKGNELLTFRRKNLSGDPYTEEPTIDNSRISFNWENLGRPGIEVVAYAS